MKKKKTKLANEKFNLFLDKTVLDNLKFTKKQSTNKKAYDELIDIANKNIDNQKEKIKKKEKVV